MTRLSFRHEEDLSDNNMKLLHNSLGSKNSVVLQHAEYCGHCHAMRPEFEEFKKQVKHDIFEFESAVLQKLSQHPKVYKTVTPGNGSMYFPMIFVFVIVKGMSKPKRFLYEGPRTSEALKTFIKEKKGELSKAARPAKGQKKRKV